MVNLKKDESNIIRSKCHILFLLLLWLFSRQLYVCLCINPLIQFSTQDSMFQNHIVLCLNEQWWFPTDDQQKLTILKILINLSRAPVCRRPEAWERDSLCPQASERPLPGGRTTRPQHVHPPTLAPPAAGNREWGNIKNNTTFIPIMI